MITQLLKIVRESIKAVPAMKYALAVAGILAVVAMVGAFRLSPQTAIFGAVITLVLMVAMVIFARLATTAPKHFLLPVKVMMWAFLCVTVATAFLLFTSAFFRWPRGLRELLDPSATPQMGRADPEELRNLIAAAQLQRAGQDYVGAWNTIQRALATAPQSKAAQDEELQIALVSLREMPVPAGDSFVRVVQPFLDVLHRRLITAKGSLAADIRAHIAIANDRKSNALGTQLPVDEDLAAAIAMDQTNPFARAMLGSQYAQRRRPIANVREQFRLALTTGRERAYVQEIRTRAFARYEPEESYLELLNIADEARRNGETLSIDARRKIFYAAFDCMGRDKEVILLSTFPPDRLLVTLRWLVDGISQTDSAHTHYYLGRLAEATGDFATAVAEYRALAKHDTTYNDRVQAGLARCEQLLAKASAGAGARE